MTSLSLEKNALWTRIPELWRRRFEVLSLLAGERGISLCLVGGCVRDLILKRAPLDWDVMGEGDLAPLIDAAAPKLQAGVISHPSFLTFTLHFNDGTALDVTTARTETYAAPAALPAVAPAAVHDDFKRRDFTVNTLALAFSGGAPAAVIDPAGGLADLKRKTIRALHSESFKDDPTRIFRAARYAGRFGFTVEPETLRWIRGSVAAGVPGLLTPARLRAELEKILAEDKPAAILALLQKWGAFSFVSSLKASAAALKKVDRALPAAAKKSAWGPADSTIFYRLLQLYGPSGAAAAQSDLRRLEFPKNRIQTVTQALEWKQFLARPGRAAAPVCPVEILPFVAQFLKENVPARTLARWKKSRPELTGDDLKKAGYPPGPLYQEILAALTQARWKGRLRTAQAETRFLIDKFPRKN